jgi:hypothetical protein
MPMGCAKICLRSNWAKDYISMNLSTSNKGWHSQWSYRLKNDVSPSLLEHALPEYTGRVIEVVPKSWGWGVLKDSKKIADHLAKGLDG